MIPQRIRDNFTTPWQRTLYIMFIAQLMTAVGYSSIFPFLPLYVQDLGTSTNLRAELLAGLVYSSQAFTMMIASPVWGTLADRYGRKLMVERSLFGGVILLLLMAFVTTAEQLIVLRGIQGLITGTIAAANALVASVVPRKHTGYAMGLMQVGLGAGVALGPLIGGAVADVLGYSEAFYITASLLLLAGLLVLFGVKEDFTPQQEKQGERFHFIAEWRHILSASGVILAYGMRFMSTLGRMMVIPIAPLFIVTLMEDTSRVNTFTGLMIGVSSAATTISAVYLGRLGDRLGQRKILIVCTLLAALLYLPQSMVTAPWQILVLQALVGIALGGILPAISALLARLTKPGEEGAVYGLDNSINAGARSVAPLLGAAVAASFSLRATFVATALLFLSMGLVVILRMPRSGRTQQTSKI
jgi:DHA1 family multidrug resistance protein-like MFS transporter